MTNEFPRQPQRPTAPALRPIAPHPLAQFLADAETRARWIAWRVRLHTARQARARAVRFQSSRGAA